MSGAEHRHAPQEAIRFHYDVGTEFYRLWLDPTLTYSAALWGDAEDTADDADALERAQLHKLDFAVEQARAAGATHVLDVGCGWGSLLSRAVRTHGVQRATGLTLSTDQAEYIRKQAWPGVDVELTSFVDHRSERPYDALFCIGALEHFARPGLSDSDRLTAYRAFFRWAADVLSPGRYMYLQTIAYGATERSKTLTFLQREIFPQSDLPRLFELSQAADRLFEVVLVRNDRHDYERTTKIWDRRLRLASERAAQCTSQETVKRYSTYLRLAAIGFHTGSLVLYRIALRRS